jgi:nucleotide-binding universal stress UspA family protein
VKFQTIVAPLDGSESARAALPVASALAQLEHAPLLLLHVSDRPLPPRELAQKLGLTSEQIRGYVLDQTTGPPADGILRYAGEQEAPLIVLCKHAGTAEPPDVVGPVTREVVIRAAAPLVLVPPERGSRPWSLRRILLPHDGTPTTAAAMDPAGTLARRAGAQLHVLYVAAPGAERPTEPGTLTTPRYLDQPQHEWPSWAAEFVDRMTALGHPPADLEIRLSVATGAAGEEIVRAARENDADLIILAWHGRWEPQRALTAKTVVREAAQPVFLFRL